VQKPLTETKDTEPSSPMNQCDGCRVNAPYITRLGYGWETTSQLHRMPDGGAMGCTKYLYHEPGELKKEVEEILDKLPKV